MFINITDSETGNNKLSCAALVNYLEKENRLEAHKCKPEFWFNGFSNNISPQEVRVKIDNNMPSLQEMMLSFPYQYQSEPKGNPMVQAICKADSRRTVKNFYSKGNG